MGDYYEVDAIYDEILDFLLSQPTPEQIIAFHASERAQARLRYLLDANRKNSLTNMERFELDEASGINHFFIMLKARAQKIQMNSDKNS